MRPLADVSDGHFWFSEQRAQGPSLPAPTLGGGREVRRISYVQGDVGLVVMEFLPRKEGGMGRSGQGNPGPVLSRW